MQRVALGQAFRRRTRRTRWGMAADVVWGVYHLDPQVDLDIPREAREFVVDAWRMVVPKKVSRAYDLTNPDGPG